MKGFSTFSFCEEPVMFFSSGINPVRDTTICCIFFWHNRQAEHNRVPGSIIEHNTVEPQAYQNAEFYLHRKWA